MKKANEISHTKVAKANVGIATAKPAQRLDGVKIFCPTPHR
jgi:hypothetical protein